MSGFITHTVETDVEIEISVRCDYCGEELDIRDVDKTEPYYVKVEPCEKCIRNAEEEAARKAREEAE